MNNSLGVPLPFPKTRPIHDGIYGQPLVNKILARSHELFGPPVTVPAFVGITWTGPRPSIVLKKDMTKVAIEVSDLADRDWECFVIEVAHEAVHLLNPIRGNASYLEEGIAEEFSKYIQAELGIAFMPHDVKQYNDAVAMLGEIPMNAFTFAKEVRAKLGALTGFTAGELMEHFPALPPNLAVKLSSICRTVE